MKEFENVRVPWPGWTTIAQIGEGGYGIVYRIERTQSGVKDRAALKVIRIPKNENEYRQILKDAGSHEKAKAYIKKQKDKVIKEIENLKTFKGTGNIVTIEDWAVEKLDDGYSWELFIRMELLTSLDKVIEEKGVPSEDVIIKIGKDICNALRLCEKERIIHRDIKQENILVTKYGDYKLSDFGISRNLEDITTVTGVGAKPYMAPEVAKYLKTGKTIDTYSLGVVMYELLNNNRLPFIDPEEDFTALDKGRAISRRLEGERIPDPTNGSEELKKIVLKACEFNPKDRYQSAEEMYKALTMLISGMELVKKTTESFEEEPVEENQRQLVAKYALEYNKLRKELDEVIGKKFAYLKKEVIHQEDFDESSKYDDEFYSILEKMKDVREKATALITDEYNADDEISIDELEKGLFGEASGEHLESKKIEFAAINKMDEEFPGLLDDEYRSLAKDNYNDDVGDAFSYVSEDNDGNDFIQRLKADKLGRRKDSNSVSDEENGETAKKVAKFYSLQRKNEEFQELLDEEYKKLKSYALNNLRPVEDATIHRDTEISEELNDPVSQVEQDPEEVKNYSDIKHERTIKKRDDITWSSPGKDIEKKERRKGKIIIGLLIVGAIIFNFRDYFSSFIPSKHKEDEVFKTYVQELYDNADIYIQGFPTYYLEQLYDNSDWVPGLLHLKYSIADFDGDRQNELVIYSAFSETVDWFYGPNLPNDSELRGYLYFYEMEDNKVKEIHHTDYAMGGSCLDDVVFYNSGIGMYDGEKTHMGYNNEIYHEWNIYDINGKNFSEEDGGVYLRFREIDSNVMQRDIVTLQSRMEYKEITKKQFENEWEDYKSSGKEIPIDFTSFDTLNDIENEDAKGRKETNIKIEDILGNTEIIKISSVSSISSKKDAVDYARKVAGTANIDLSYSDNIMVECEQKDIDGYHIRAYEDHPEHIVTIFTCRILPSGVVRDFVSRQTI